MKDLEDICERAFSDPDKQRKNLVSVVAVVVVQVKSLVCSTQSELEFGMIRKGALISRSISSKFIHLSKLVILI